MNFLDLIVVVVFLVAFTLAFFVGIVRSLGALVSLLVGLVGASFFYRTLGDQVLRLSSSVETSIANLIGFIVALLVVSAVADYLLIRSFRVVHVRGRSPLASRGGLPVMLVQAILAAFLAVAIVTVLVQVTDRSLADLPEASGTTWLERQLDGSKLADQALRGSPLIYHVVNALTPGTVPAILEPTP